MIAIDQPSCCLRTARRWRIVPHQLQRMASEPQHRFSEKNNHQTTMKSVSSSAPSARMFPSASVRGHRILHFCSALTIGLVTATLCHAANITLPGTGILGIKTNIDGTLGTLRIQQG
jgi:hypothetical protein